MIVVTDTTPVNYLILIDQVHLLKELYGRLVLPRAVHEEMQRGLTPSRRCHSQDQQAEGPRP
jgi:predicted nucleic acid-binding protein